MPSHCCIREGPIFRLLHRKIGKYSQHNEYFVANNAILWHHNTAQNLRDDLLANFSDGRWIAECIHKMGLKITTIERHFYN